MVPLSAGSVALLRPAWVVAVRPLYVLMGIVTLAAFLRLWRLDEVGFGNLYYAATVRSMLASPSNFLFGAFDPAGFVTVDKPPVGFMVQAAFVAALGWNGLALQLPQAIAGTASIPLLYALVARTFGAGAGLVAALALAITPVSVAVERNNTIDAQLGLIVLGATYALLRAVERADLRWLLACAALLGLGFNVKMSQAYLALPALAVTYLVAARTDVPRRVAHLTAFAAVTVAVSLAWIAVADLTPRDQRPYIGSSTNDSALQLALGHNGAARLGPLTLGVGRPGPQPAGPPGPTQPRPPAGPGPVGPGPLGPGPQGEVGENGALRLFNQQLAGQVSWSLPLALVGAAVAWTLDGRRRPITPRQRDVLLWLTWLIPTAVFLSFGGIIHRYYLVMLAPPIAALTGVAIVTIAGMGGRARAGLAMVAVGATAAVALNAISAVSGVWSLLPALVIASAGASMLGLALLSRWPRVGRPLALSCALLAVPPLLWATTPLDGGAAGLPYASPELLRGGGGPRPVGGPGPSVPGADTSLTAYLLSQRGGERFIAATGSSTIAAPLIVTTGLPVMAIGGFSGSDPILDRAAFARRVAGGEVRFVIADDRLRGDIRDLVSSRCIRVPDGAWRPRPPQLVPGPPAPPGPGGPGPGPQSAQVLFDCAALRG